MARQGVFGRTRATVGFNMTPMIDCTFQLILFFLLATQMLSADYVEMDLPEPHVNRSEQLDEPNKVIINVVPHDKQKVRNNPEYAGLAKCYQVKTVVIEKDNTQKLQALLLRARRDAQERRAQGDFVVEIRADREVHFKEILPVLRAVQGAEIEKMRITTIVKGAQRSAA